MRYPIDETIADKVREWLRAGRGVAVWQNADLGSASVGSLAFTPGDETGSPHWRYGRSPIAVSHSPAEFAVRQWKESSRVKVRRGPPYLGGIHRLDRPRLDRALALAGPGATWRYIAYPDYGSAWATVCVESLAGETPLSI